MITLNGRAERVPYSLSRWTDVPAAKWPWMQQQLDQGWMVAIDQRTSVPARWSLKPQDTLGLLFWTKNPAVLLTEKRLQDYRVKIHRTTTGWHEVEPGCPTIQDACDMFCASVRYFGPDNVIWRFSPIPLLPDSDVVMRFRKILNVAGPIGLRSVFVSFLQTNDQITETRTDEEKRTLLRKLTSEAKSRQIRVKLCADDQAILVGQSNPGVSTGVCAPPEDFIYGRNLERDVCGCGFSVDPFSINETCTGGCLYCYAGDKTSAPKKRNTATLPILR